MIVYVNNVAILTKQRKTQGVGANIALTDAKPQPVERVESITKSEYVPGVGISFWSISIL